MSQKLGGAGTREGHSVSRVDPRDVWIEGSNSVLLVGLKHILETEWRVLSGVRVPEASSLACAIICVEGKGGLAEGVSRIRESFPEAPVLVFGLSLDLPLASVALQAGARGYLHAGMGPDQVRRAVKVAVAGEMVAPRQLLGYLISGQGSVDLDLLSSRQREILKLVADGLSNAQIADRLYLSESTVKQHLRSAYKLLGVNNRTEAASLVRKGNI
jgi:DNA-binding NarL/FixJ family response regulator